jgi:hypothetical protein
LAQTVWESRKASRAEERARSQRATKKESILGLAEFCWIIGAWTVSAQPAPGAGRLGTRADDRRRAALGQTVKINGSWSPFRF